MSESIGPRCTILDTLSTCSYELTRSRGGPDNSPTLNTSLVDSRHVGERLVQASIITRDILEDALGRATRDRQWVGEALVAMGATSAEDVLKALAAQQELPWLEAEEMPSTPPALKELSAKYL